MTIPPSSPATEAARPACLSNSLLLTHHPSSPHLTSIMFYSTAVIAAAAFSGLVAAQSTNETGTGPQINAGSVDYTTRQTWCRIQTQTCPQLCNGPTEPNGNNCDPVSDRHLINEYREMRMLTTHPEHPHLLLRLLRHRQQPQRLRLPADSPRLRLPRVHRPVRERSP